MTIISITEFIGRLHPAIVHLPIGILLTTIILQWISVNEKYKISAEVIKILLMAGMFTALISCITGYMLSLKGNYEINILSLHMWMGFAVVAFSMLIIIRTFNGRMDLRYRILTICLFVLIIVTGHLGGSLTHGSNYLMKSYDQNKAVKIVPVQNKVFNEEIINKYLLQRKLF